MLLLLVSMINVTILGTGKVASHLIKSCINNPSINLVEIYNRSEKGLSLYRNLTPVSTNTNNLKQADIYVLALPDDVIGQIDLSYLKGLVVHTSGTKSLKLLKAERRGVLYPAQSFSKEKKVNFKTIPICVETEFKVDFNLLQNFALTLTNNVYDINEKARQKLHLAAVFANNFSNRVIGIAYDICKENHIDFKILQPLLQETFLKTQILTPGAAQTGPAVRNDTKTIKKHLNQLTGTNREIYKILTKSIQEKHDTEL